MDDNITIYIRCDELDCYAIHPQFYAYTFKTEVFRYENKPMLILVDWLNVEADAFTKDDFENSLYNDLEWKLVMA